MLVVDGWKVCGHTHRVWSTLATDVHIILHIDTMTSQDCIRHCHSDPSGGKPEGDVDTPCEEESTAKRIG